MEGRLNQQRGGDIHVRVIIIVLMVGERNLRRCAGGVLIGPGGLRCVVVVRGVVVRQTVAHLGTQQWYAQQNREQSA